MLCVCPVLNVSCTGMQNEFHLKTENKVLVYRIVAYTRRLFLLLSYHMVLYGIVWFRIVYTPSPSTCYVGYKVLLYRMVISS